ncbi:MAG: hypothetical protein HQ546_06630 [Planctomycetes bacterium]|nr:hypothetical protein [Planctomycetota bacterium]
MKAQTKTTARELAIEALLDREGMVCVHLHRLLSQRSVDATEAHFATELVHGVTRRRRTLDEVIRAYSARPGRSLPATVREILRLAVYQLIFLERVPAFAAVNEAVASCLARHPRSAGFVNALARAVSVGCGELQNGPAPLTGQCVAITPDSYRQMDRKVFHSRPSDAGQAALLGQLCSLPNDLAGRWLKRSRSPADAFVEAMQSNARPPMVARVNAARTTVAEVLSRLASEGVQAVAHENGSSIVFVEHANVTDLEVFRLGLITPQDATATAVALAAEVRPGMRVLDFCASPGTKTTHMGELMADAGEIVAVDVKEEKLALIEAASRRCGLGIIRTCLAEHVGALEGGSFDRILVDAPCSNSGVLARRVEARWRFQADRLGRLAGDQRQLLALAAAFLAPGGRMIYSTCSIEPEENQDVVRGFLRKHGQLKLLTDRCVGPLGFAPPQRYRDGGYFAVLAR